MPTVVLHCRRAQGVLDPRGLCLLIPGLLGVVLVIALASSSDSTAPLGVPTLLGAVYLVCFVICPVVESRVRASFVTSTRGNLKPDALQAEHTSDPRKRPDNVTGKSPKATTQPANASPLPFREIGQ
jgi:hypothetical protein